MLVNHSYGLAEGYGDAEFADRLFLAGGASVFLFFALTGYLLFLPFARRDYGRGGGIELGRYARNRALRVLPLYFVAVAVLLVANESGGSGEQWLRFSTLTESFYSDSVITVDPPMWSLVVELHFYALLPLIAWALALASRKRELRAALLIAGLGAASLFVWYLEVHRLGDVADPRWRYSLPVTFLAFVPGMLLAIARVKIESGPVSPWLPPRLALIAAAIGLWVVSAYDFSWSEPAAVAASGLVLAAIVLPARQDGPVRALDWRPLAALGVASYSLYIWHQPVIAALERRADLGFVPLLALALPVCIAIATVSYLVIERPFLRLRRRWAR